MFDMVGERLGNCSLSYTVLVQAPTKIHCMWLYPNTDYFFTNTDLFLYQQWNSSHPDRTISHWYYRRNIIFIKH